MKTTAKKHAKNAPRKPARTVHKSAKTSNAALIIRQMGDEWAEHWNAGALDKVVAAYASDAVYLPPHHKKGRSGQVLDSLEAGECKVADRCRRLV
jgi:hypothetical protein